MEPDFQFSVFRQTASKSENTTQTFSVEVCCKSGEEGMSGKEFDKLHIEYLRLHSRRQTKAKENPRQVSADS